MFFAVPHHGLDIWAWRKFTTLVLKINTPVPGITPTRKMEEEAVTNSADLLAITTDFRPLQESLFFVNYTEGKLMKGLTAPVRRTPAPLLACEHQSHTKQCL